MLGSSAVIHSPLTDADVLGSLESHERNDHQGSIDIKSVSPLQDIGTTASKRKHTIRIVENDGHDNESEPPAASNESVGETDIGCRQVSPTSSLFLAPDRNIFVSLQKQSEPTTAVEVQNFASSIPQVPHPDASPEYSAQPVASASQNVAVPSTYPLHSEADKTSQEPTKRLRKKVPIIAQPDLTASRSFFSSDMWDLQNGSNQGITERTTVADVPTVRRRSLSDFYQTSGVSHAEGSIEGSPLPGVMKKTKPKKRSLSGISQPDLIGLGSWAPVRASGSARKIDADEQRPIKMMGTDENILPDVTPRWENIDTSKLLSPITESMSFECDRSDGCPRKPPVQLDGPSQSSDESAPINSVKAPLSHGSMTFVRKESDDHPGEPIQRNELAQVGCSPINSIQAPLPDNAFISEREESVRQFGEIPVQRDGPMEISDESDPINSTQTPRSHKELSLNRGENDGRLEVQGIGLSQSSGESSSINSAQAPPPDVALSSEQDESVGQSRESPVQRDGPIERSDESTPIISIETPLSLEEMSFGCEDGCPGGPVQRKGLAQSVGESSPVNSIQEPIPDDAEREESIGQSGDSPVQRDGLIESSDESDPILSMQTPLSREETSYDCEKYDGHPGEPIQLAQSTSESSPHNSIQGPLPDEVSSDSEESDDRREYPVQRAGLIQRFDERDPIDSIQMPNSHEAMSYDRKENDGHPGELVQPNGLAQSLGVISPIGSIQSPLPDDAMSFDQEENDDISPENPVQPNGEIQSSGDNSPINSNQAPLPYDPVQPPVEQSEPMQSSYDSSPIISIQTPLPYETISLHREEYDGHPVSSPVPHNREIQISAGSSQINSIQAPLPYEAIDEDTFYDAVNGSPPIDNEFRDSEANRQLLGVQEENAQAPSSLTPQSTQSSLSDSGYETTSSLQESTYVEVETSPESHPSRVVKLDIQPQTTDSEAPIIPYADVTCIEEHDATDSGDNPSSIMNTDIPPLLKTAYVSAREDQGVTEGDLLELMIHPGTSENPELDDEALSQGTATARADIQNIDVTKADEEEMQSDEAMGGPNCEIPCFHVPEGDLEEDYNMSATTIKEIPRLIDHVPLTSSAEECNEVGPESLTSEYKRRGAVLTMDEQPAKFVNSHNQVTDELAVLAQIEALNKMLMSDSKAPCSNLGVQESDHVNSGKPTGEFEGDQIDFWNRLSAHGENLAKREPDMFAARIEMGVPSACRGKVWMILTESRSQVLINKYDDLWNNARLYFESTIVRDVENRSQNRNAGVETSALRRLMTAYFALDIRLGYCFNLQYLAQILLDNMSEADSLCTLSSVMKSPGLYRLREWYCGEGLEVALYQLGKLVEEHLPELASHLSSRKVAVGDYSIEWFTSLFTTQAPAAFAIRILDLYFLEGPKFIFKVAVVLLRSLERSLMLCASSEEIQDVLNRTLFQSFEVPDQLIQQALSIAGISESKLEQYEVECKIRTWRTRQSLDSTVVVESGPEEKEEPENARPVSATPSEPPVPPLVPSPSPTPASSMIPSGLYSLFARASRRRSEASGKYGSQEPSSKSATNGTHSRTGSASSAISGTRPGLFGHPSVFPTATQSLEGARDVSTPFPKFSPPVFSSEFLGRNVQKDHEGLLRKSEEERARLDTALSTSAAKNVNLANDLLLAQNSLARERGSNSVLRKEVNSLQIQMAESEIRSSMMEAELKLLQSRMDQNELESMRIKAKWDRLMTALLDG